MTKTASTITLEHLSGWRLPGCCAEMTADRAVGEANTGAIHPAKKTASMVPASYRTLRRIDFRGGFAPVGETWTIVDEGPDSAKK